MTLTYRGVTYQTSDLTVDVQKTELKATYRGQSYQVNALGDFIFKPAQNLIYRGIKYNNSTESNGLETIQNLQPVFH